jgi:oxygen-independent coproporphyrinogen III oxidase
MASKSKQKDISLYIHIPFCKSTCLYCAFPRFANKKAFISPYIQKLLKEIENESSTYIDYKVSSIYIGGGTPSFIPAENIVSILDKLRTNFNVAKNAEISIESNPESFTKESIKILKQAGVNRFSIGFQSLNDKTLKKIGRPHGSKEIIHTLRILKEEKIKNWGCDMIIGLPYQTIESFKKEVETLLSHQPPHLSFYFLSHDTKNIELFIKDCPNEDEQIEMYNYLTKKLKKAGYLHYEVSNYAKPGFECKHNLRYWRQQEYLGLGLGAHSYINNKVWSNTENLTQYLSKKGETQNEITLDPELKKMDYILLNLRTQPGIKRSDYTKYYDDYDQLIKKIGQFKKDRLIKSSKSTITLTEKGFLFADFVTRQILD